MRYAHILARATEAPWLITEAGASAITSLLNSRLADEAPPAVAVEPPEESVPVETGKNIALISVRGILGKRLSMMEAMCGGVDVDTVLAEVRAAVDDPEVGTVILHFDSPGGTAIGIPEAFAQLSEMREQSEKELIAFVDGRCCSAAMYLAAACDVVFCTPTAQLGSIGCVLHMAFRAMKNAAEGVEVRTYKYGKFKDLGNPNRIPTAEEDALIQERVDFLGQMFEADMRKARPQLKEEVFDALVYFGGKAVEVGLADEVVQSLESLIEQLNPVDV